ncbi:MAG: hypothetical protein MJZ57_08970 [Bacteroidales bacterium]|nr:hypothetical protein [Bacteroidales bacterium]
MMEPKETINSLTRQLRINRSAVQKQMDNWEQKGYVLRSKLGGEKWYVAITPSM